MGIAGIEQVGRNEDMKTIGLIGGMSWESTVTYYQLINEYMKCELGGLHSAKILLYSVDFAEIEEYQARSEWEKSAEVLGTAARNLEKAGADLIVICTNTMHKNVPTIQKMIDIPIIHIADTTADELIKDEIHTVGLLGTKYTMLEDFYKQRLLEKKLSVLIPDPQDIEIVNHVIYDELCLGIISEESEKEYSRIIKKMKERGAEAVILGCTEIGLLVKQKTSVLPIYDTTRIHAETAAKKAIE